LIDDAFDDAANAARAEFALRLTLKFRLRKLDGDDSRETFAEIFSRERRCAVLASPAAFGRCRDVAIERTGQCGPEADEVGSAFDCIDVIREGIDGFVVRVVVLNRDFGINDDVTTMIVEAALTVKKDRLWMEGTSSAGSSFK